MSPSHGRFRRVSQQIQGRPVIRLIDRGHDIGACLSCNDGGEVSSLTVTESNATHELLFNANNWRPIEGWPGKAPWLWPVAGRTYALNSRTGQPESKLSASWRHNGRVRSMPHHGFAKRKAWQLIEPQHAAHKDSLHARLVSDESDREIYPFDYRIDSVTKLADSCVRTSLAVTSSAANTLPMPFTIGKHFTFDFSSWWGRNWLDGLLTGFDNAAWGTCPLNLRGKAWEMPLDGLRLSDPRLENALIAARPGVPVSLVSPDRSRRIEMSFTLSGLPADDAALWVVHRDPRRRFFCLEPWVGWPNGLNTGEGRVELQPGETWHMSIELRLTPAHDEEAGRRMEYATVEVSPNLERAYSARHTDDHPRQTKLSGNRR